MELSLSVTRIRICPECRKPIGENEICNNCIKSHLNTMLETELEELLKEIYIKYLKKYLRKSI